MTSPTWSGVVCGRWSTLNLLWEPEEIDVRVHDDAGCLRYRSTIKAVVAGNESAPGRFWHTDFYEKRNGRWEVVWSQATRAAN